MEMEEKSTTITLITSVMLALVAIQITLHSLWRHSQQWFSEFNQSVQIQTSCDFNYILTTPEGDIVIVYKCGSGYRRNLTHKKQ